MKSKKRIILYDIIRFFLILKMVWVHIVYTWQLSLDYPSGVMIKILPTTVLFAFLMGIVIRRFDLRSRKLLVKGVKLVTVFLVVNLLTMIFFKIDTHWFEILTFGNPDYAVLQILLSLGYASMLISFVLPLLQWLKRNKLVAVFVLVGLFIFDVVFEIPYNLQIILYSFAGYFYASIVVLDKLSFKKHSLLFVVSIVVLPVLIYLSAIVTQIYQFVVTWLFMDMLVIFAILYSRYRWKLLRSDIVLQIGQNSFFIFVAQVFVVKVLAVLGLVKCLNDVNGFISLMYTVIMLGGFYVVIKIVRRSKALDDAYRFVFK